MANNQPVRSSTHASGGPAGEIPDKLYFRIGEVARLCDVPTYVLRFWESEFPQLKPNKGGTGQRLYRRRDVEMALRVRSLLKEEGYTIPGARAVLKAEFRHKEPQLSLLGAPDGNHTRQLRALRRELASIAEILSRPPEAALNKASAVHSIRSSRRPALRPADRDAHAQSGELSFEPDQS